VIFTEAQRERLEKIFPEGVCDWSKPGVGQQPTIGWQTYQNAAVRRRAAGRSPGVALGPRRGAPSRQPRGGSPRVIREGRAA
jgi:Tannase-like family of unknown function (DUF6351)